VLANLFAYRAISPKTLKQAPDPIGPDNDKHLKKLSRAAAHTICAWGNHGALLQRAATVLPLLDRPLALGITKQYQPLHPLYCPADRQPELFSNLTAKA
jgi:hypothetical protein